MPSKVMVKEPARTDGALDPLLRAQAVADALDIPVQTLYVWRTKGAGPRGIKVGRHLRYRRSDVEAWLDAQTDDRPADGGTR